MGAGALDNPLLDGLVGDGEIAAQLSADTELAQYIRFEAALARAEAEAGVIPEAAAAAINGAVFSPDLEALRDAAARDGVPSVEFVRQFREKVGEPHAQYVHFGATSQDLLDTSLILRLASITEIFEQRLRTLIGALEQLSARFGAHRLVGRTRMQDALPISVGTRIEAWSLPLARHLSRLDELRPRLLVLQFGGAVGTLDRLGAKGRDVAERLAALLGLGCPVSSWHTQRDSLAEFAAWLSLVTGSLGKMGEDISLMAQNAIGEVELEGGGGSSAMPHKRNPVKAEVLVTLARYNATLLPAMHHALVAEQERSGTAWTLEWLTLPQMVMACGASLRTAVELAGAVRGMGKADGQ